MEKSEKTELTRVALKKKSFDWEEYLISLGIEISKGILVGASMSVGRIAIERVLAPKIPSKSLSLIAGGNQKVG